MRKTVSLASEPEEVKKTRLNCGGLSSASFSDRAMTGGWLVLKNVL